MPELPKRLVEYLTPTPLLGVTVLTAVLVVRWLEGKHRRELERERESAAVTVRRREEQYRERLDEKGPPHPVARA